MDRGTKTILWVALVLLGIIILLFAFLWIDEPLRSDIGRQALEVDSLFMRPK